MALLVESPPPADAAPRLAAGAWLGLVVVIAASVMDLLDATIAQTAAPAIRSELGGSFAQLEWISAAYTLAMAVGLLVGGRLGDLFGRARVMLFGMAGFAVASLLCALAPSTGALIAGRVLQGAIGALMIPQGFGLIRELFGDGGQQRAFAIFGPVMGMTAVVGPVVGGALVDLDLFGWGWRTIFLVNLPIAAAAIALGLRHLPRTAPAAERTRIDGLSVGLAAAGTSAIVYPLVQGHQLGWPAWSLALIAGGVALLAVFGRRQTRLGGDRSPLVEPSILKRRAYVMGLALVVSFIGAMGGMLLVLNVLFQAGLGFSPLACGVATLAIPLAAVFGSITSSALLARLGRTTIHIGTATMAAGLLVCDLVLRGQGGDLSAWQTAAPLALTGFGMGMVFVPMFDVILAGVHPHQLGSASGLLEAVQQLGMSLGIAIVGTVLFDVLGAAGGPAAFVDAADHALLVAVGFLAVAFTVTWWLPRHARQG
jgi:EmrB/QacA subfamily drug resistance transporter